MFNLPTLPELITRIPVILIALTVHEFSHGYAALKCGDDTALRAGRLTFNPMAHLDFIGTICLLFAPIGWAKPVPVNPYYFRHPRRDEMIVSFAGPASNFAQALIFAVLMKIIVPFLPAYEPATPYAAAVRHPGAELLMAVLFFGVVINVGLGIFNLIPLFPLDGSHILSNMLPYEQRRKYEEFNRYAPFVILGLVLFGGGLLSNIIWVPVDLLMRSALSADNFRKVITALANLQILK
jgi:Zn-dependent protease